jgi:hypothetical protein
MALGGKMNQETNRYLHSLIEPDGCWHKSERKYEYDENEEACNPHWKCKYCNELSYENHKLINPDYFKDWNGFGILWEWAIKQEWFYDFIHSNYGGLINFCNKTINYKTFPELLAEWVRGRG